MKAPNLYIVGAAKSGTTSLHNYLDEHDDIYMSNPKELNFFSKAEILSQNLYYDMYLPKNFSSYLKIFEGGLNYKYQGESSVSYIYYEKVPKKIKDISPDAKIIIMLRNPSDRAVSHYLMDTRLGYNEHPLEDIIDKKKDLKTIELFYQQFIELGFYSRQVNRYLNVFGKKNVKIIIFDEFVANRKRVIEDVLDFLKIKNQELNIEIKHNKFISPSSRPINFLFKNKYLRKISSNFPEIIKKLIFRLFFSEKKPLINQELKNKLTKIYKKDLQSLEKIIDRDLSMWYN
tara:strand:+ start:878 stop:1741 length:864 start_codon:yes stop_codon:yes gene_type:complete